MSVTSKLSKCKLSNPAVKCQRCAANCSHHSCTPWRHPSIVLLPRSRPSSTAISTMASSPTASASFPLSSPLFRLPAVLRSHVCSYHSPKELLVTTALTSKATRNLLTPACFFPSLLELGARELSLLSRLPDSLSERLFYFR